MNNTTSHTNILKKINAVTVDISTWSGGASLKKEDIGVDIPERAFSLGRKYLIAPERLTPFISIRRRARERCLKVGVRFLGGFALPADQYVMDTLVHDLEDLRREFDAKKADLLRDFHSAVDEWVSEEPVRPFEHLIRAALPPLSSIDKRMQFRYSIYQVGAPEEAAAQPLEQVTAEIGPTLFGEVSSAAADMAKAFRERNAANGVSKNDWTFSSRTVDTVTGLRNKLKGLEFVSESVPAVVDEIDRVLATLPREGKLEGPLMRQLYALLHVLSDEHRMLEFGQGLLAIGDVVQQEFGTFVRPAPLPTQAAMEIAVPEAPDVAETASDDVDPDWDEADETETVVALPPPIAPALNLSGLALSF